ncbi:ATPase family AAA domain-containing protein 5 isoform X2 [Genypterus blacodes]|uniref:ATPase family AAA domain-containing protein 5 isoform X2 n=1 Tax=Genypterus blacodes TaxID=154954 RepID=UPI003F76B1CE
MAGVVAMASVIEDFETQPCKKSRKDGSSPVVKTITNYFSPVPKPAEKAFSPPRSNNIMDYFSRKAPTSREKTSAPDQSKENCQLSQSAEKHSSVEPAVKQPPQKRGRKASKAARKLETLESVHSTKDESCIIVEEPNGGSVISSGILGSDTAALLAQICPDDCIATTDAEGYDSNTMDVERVLNDGYHEDVSKCGSHVKLQSELNCSSALSEVVPLKEKAKHSRPAARNPRKRQQQEAKHSESEENEAEKSLCDVSTEVNIGDESQLNASTVTVSFEEFVRSHNHGSEDEDIEEKGDIAEGMITMEAEDTHTKLVLPKGEGKVGSPEPSLQVSPRILTIQAEIHAVSPKQEATRAVGKLASIFTQKKGAVSPQEKMTSPSSEAGHQLSSFSFPLKRKSNVVLQEEDLELAVVESEFTPKCSEVDKKHFLAAFKQPSAEGPKTKPGKSQGKQKQPGEKTSEPSDKGVEKDNVALPVAEQGTTATVHEKKAKTKKPTTTTKKGRRKVEEEKDAVTTSSASPSAKDTAMVGVNAEAEESPITSSTSIPAARRSRRNAVSGQAPVSTAATPVQQSRRKNTAKDAAKLPKDNPVMVSTPKRRRSKRGVYVAELVCPPDNEESPIRIKFTRVGRNECVSKAASESDAHTPLAAKTSDASKKRRRAKKLVEKAKVIQQSKKSAVEAKSTLRRSSRSEKKSYCEDEDSVICLDEKSSPAKSKPRKPLRSLHDVLGKAAPVGKESSKVAQLSQERSGRRSSTVVSIFDESSRDGSENSQDDEQFRARRDFLKSGLPESFRKQIAKTAATKEAYSLSCSSFQPVIHMRQPPKDCRLWSLPWPESSFLCHLKELWCQTSVPLPSVTGSFSRKTEAACLAVCERGSGWRPEMSESVRALLMEEVGTLNPSFPAQTFLARFLKRRTDHLQQCTASETVSASTPLPVELIGVKRKRMDEGEIMKVAKKQRSNQPEENASTTPLTKTGGRSSRATRRRLSKEKEKEKEKAVCSVDDCLIVVDDLQEDAGRQGVVKEDMLWTDKYQPQHSSDILGNTASVRKLHSWLKEWKLRTDREERKGQKEKKHEEGSNDSEWDCGEGDTLDGEDTLCNTLLITGPTGVGKTAAVYACAMELGFKVFEVNASSQRSGRLILSQLKEATQSHQVDTGGVSAHKPTYFNSYGISSSAGAVKPGTSPRKVNSPRSVVSSPRKHPQSPRGTKRGLAPTSLANFFKVGRHTNKEPPNTKRSEQTGAPKKTLKTKEVIDKSKELTVKSPPAPGVKEKSGEEQSKKTATSLILFEEVDVNFDEDSGFLAAIKTFMTTTKRPVILTTSDPAFSSMFDGNFEEIHFKTPSVVNVGSYLQLLCLAEDLRTDLSDVCSLLSLNRCDIRQSMLQLQFWTRSAGGRPDKCPIKGEPKPESHGEAEEAGEASTLPPCDTGCTESMLGLLNIEPQRTFQELFRIQSPAEEAVCWELLMDSRRRGVDLLYSNMETLLPLPVRTLAVPAHKPSQCLSLSQDQASNGPRELPSSSQPSDNLPAHPSSLHKADSGETSDDGSPVKMSNRMKKNKRRCCLTDQDSDSDDGFVSLPKPQSIAQTNQQAEDSVVPERVKRKQLTPEEQRKSLPVSLCLNSLADFLDNMSYLDSCLIVHPSPVVGSMHRNMVPACAEVKDGMTDEPRVECDSGSYARTECVWEMQAAVEALSFHKCQAAVAEAWDKAGELEGELGKEAAAELTLPVATHCKDFSFTQDGPSHPQLVQRRREVMESLMCRGVFGAMGNRPGAALHYLPALRNICKAEQLKEQGKVKRRFLHYLDAIHLGLGKNTLQHLAEDFP